MMFSLSLRSLYMFSNYIISTSPSLSVCSHLSVHAMWNIESSCVFNLSWHCYTSVLFWRSTHSAWENSHSLSLYHSFFVPSFLASLLPLVLLSLSPPVTVNQMPANTGTSKCTADWWVATLFVGVSEEKGRRRNQEWKLWLSRHQQTCTGLHSR